MNKKLKFALVGAGRIAKRHAEILKGDLVKDAQVIAISDTNPAKAKALGKQFDIPWYQDMHTMAEKESPDIFVVLTESGNHAANVIDLSKYGKHIMVEKPMALTLSDADEMIEACSRNGVSLFVVKQNRFNLPVQKLKEAVDKNRLGKLNLGTVRVRWCRDEGYYEESKWRGTWKMDGGVLTNQASHHIDLLEWLMGPVSSVFAYSRTSIPNIEVEDTATVILKFSNGALGIIEATTATRPNDLEGSISILGDKGSVVIGGFAVNKLQTWEFKEYEDGDELVKEKFSENPPDVYGFGHIEYYKSVVSTIKDGTPILVDGLAGRRSLELINAIYESIESCQEVKLKFTPKQCRLGITDGHE